MTEGNRSMSDLRVQLANLKYKNGGANPQLECHSSSAIFYLLVSSYILLLPILLPGRKQHVSASDTFESFTSRRDSGYNWQHVL
jgi:hypothetical protein